jgi:[ribosomal protein S5]-alanine N-acetyltransferase
LEAILLETSQFSYLSNLQTTRLVLRPLREDDAEDYFAFASDSQVVQYLRWGPHTSLDATRAYLATVIDSSCSSTDVLWGIELRQNHRLIGAVHLMDIHPEHLRAEI